jgi:hypothetical protein
MWGLPLRDCLHWLHLAAWLGAFLVFSVIATRNAMRAYSTSKRSLKTNRGIGHSVDEADEPQLVGDPLPIGQFGMRPARGPR